MVGAYCQGIASFVWSVSQIPTGVVISAPSLCGPSELTVVVGRT